MRVKSTGEGGGGGGEDFNGFDQINISNFSAMITPRFTMVCDSQCGMANKSSPHHGNKTFINPFEQSDPFDGQYGGLWVELD